MTLPGELQAGCPQGPRKGARGPSAAGPAPAADPFLQALPACLGAPRLKEGTLWKEVSSCHHKQTGTMSPLIRVINNFSRSFCSPSNQQSCSLCECEPCPALGLCYAGTWRIRSLLHLVSGAAPPRAPGTQAVLVPIRMLPSD